MIGVGVLGLGTMAIGYKAYSAWSSLGWQSAWSNGFSIANEGAVGPMSFAEHVNNYVANSVTNLAAVDQYHVVILSLIVLVVILPVVWYAQAVRKRVGQSPR